MNIPDFDMIVLSDIADCSDGWSRQELIDKHGFEISETIDFLLSNNLIKIHEHDIKPFLPPNSEYSDPPKGNIIATKTGKIEVKRWNTKQSLAKSERWKERIWGFVSGFASGVLATVVGAWIIQVLL